MVDDRTTEDGGQADSAADEPRTASRTFTCTVCGFATEREVAELRAEVGGVCLNCGGWTLQSAATAAVVDAARDAAARLAGETLTERQALAYLLRESVGLDRQAAAAAMETSASNLDNLHRRGREKVADARRVVAELDALATPDAAASDP